MKAKVIEQLRATATSDGAGVQLMRVFGGSGLARFDPFLMLDEFNSAEASDYIAGFPPHPHRGFATVTYMLQGKMEHRDHMGNIGLLEDGDVQWMTAGRGVIHSEMPQQTEGKMHGFQFWVNLPRSQKMSPASYRDIPAKDIPRFELGDISIKAIAGSAEVNGAALKGFFEVPDTQAAIFDIEVPSGAEVTLSFAAGFNVMSYTYGGEVLLGEAAISAKAKTLSRFDSWKDIKIMNSAENTAHLIVMAGIPLKEPIVQRGPFVMNTAEEIEQAILDYQQGSLT